LIHATPGMTLAAIVTGDADRRARAASRFPTARVVPDAEALWDLASALDLIVVASPNRFHVTLGMAALAHGLSVVIDKPLAARSGDARQIVLEAERCGRLLTVFQNRRWDGEFLTVRKLLAEQRLGQVFRFESRFERWRPIPRAGWRQRAGAEDAGGLLYDLGSHLIDQACVLFGPVTHVYAELDKRREAVDVDDDSFVALRHASGVRSHLWMSAVAARSAARVRVLGLGGAYVKYGLDVQEDALAAGANPADPAFGEEPREGWGTFTDGDRQEVVPTEAGSYRSFYGAVAASLRHGTPPPVDPRDAVHVLEIIEAAQTSASTSATVALRT
jgi:predicted dehydrogenase